MPTFETYEECIAFGVALIALRCGTSPETILRWPESRYLLWLSMLDTAAQFVGRNDALRISLAVWEPNKLLPPEESTPSRETFKAEAERGMTRAEQIVNMIDSQSLGSDARRRRRQRRNE